MMTHRPCYLAHLKSLCDTELLHALNNQTLLITGASGLIGRFLVDFLLATCPNIRLLLPVRKALNFADLRVSCFVANLCKPLCLPDLTKLDAIIHLASPAAPRAIAANPIETILLNVQATQNLLELASIHNAKFIFASSSEIYGDCQKPLKETDMGYLDCFDLRSCYNESKRLAETLTQAFACEKQTQGVILRIPRTFGPTFGAHDNRALASFLRDCVNNHDIYLKSNGNQVYSFLYVGDCVRAIIFALLRLPANQAYNIANGAMSLKEFALQIAQLNPKIALKIEPTHQKGTTKTQTSILDTTKIESFGFYPKFSLQEGLEWSIKILQESQTKEKI